MLMHFCCTQSSGKVFGDKGSCAAVFLSSPRWNSSPLGTLPAAVSLDGGSVAADSTQAFLFLFWWCPFSYSLLRCRNHSFQRPGWLSYHWALQVPAQTAVQSGFTSPVFRCGHLNQPTLTASAERGILSSGLPSMVKWNTSFRITPGRDLEEI